MLTLYYQSKLKVNKIIDIDIIKNMLYDPKLIMYLKVVDPTDDEMDLLTQQLHLHVITLKNYTTKKHIPKIEEYENYLSTVMYDVQYTNPENCYDICPVSIIMSENLVVTISKKDLQVFDEVSSRLDHGSKLAFNSSCSLYYILLDTLVDNLFPILTCFENKLDLLQENLLKSTAKGSTEVIMDIRRKLLELRKVFTYEQEVLYKVAHENYKLICADQLAYLKDVFHHLEKLNAMLQEYNDWAANLSDAYNSLSSAKLNDKLQMLTIISYVFMPLGFLTGWYGMGFKNMPEFQLQYGYYFFIGAVIIITIGMIIYFKKKKLL